MNYVTECFFLGWLVAWPETKEKSLEATRQRGKSASRMGAGGGWYGRECLAIVFRFVTRPATTQSNPMNSPNKSLEWQFYVTSNPFFVVKTLRRCSFFLTPSFTEILPDFIWSPTFLTFLLTLSLQPFHPGMFILSNTGMHHGCSVAAPLRSGRIQRKTNQLHWCWKRLSVQRVLTQMYLLTDRDTGVGSLKCLYCTTYSDQIVIWIGDWLSQQLIWQLRQAEKSIWRLKKSRAKERWWQMNTGKVCLLL